MVVVKGIKTLSWLSREKSSFVPQPHRPTSSLPSLTVRLCRYIG